jgi:hypothetical protein
MVALGMASLKAAEDSREALRVLKGGAPTQTDKTRENKPSSSEGT